MSLVTNYEERLKALTLKASFKERVEDLRKVTSNVTLKCEYAHNKTKYLL